MVVCGCLCLTVFVFIAVTSFVATAAVWKNGFGCCPEETGSGSG